MRITVAAIGRLRGGPEDELVRDYARRFTRTGRPLGLGPLDIQEIDERKVSGMRAEADALARALPAGATLVALDERGEALSSRQFATRLARWRDGGTANLAFVIGGADGLDPALRERADFRLSLGAMVWPHRLARVMLTEQLYRAAAILAGLPYHRD